MRLWIIVLGRGGTILLSIALALLLVSLIPASQTSIVAQSLTLGGEMWRDLHESIQTPQQSLYFSVEANGTLNAYLLEVNSQYIYGWIHEHHPDLLDPWNVTYLQEFLDANPRVIARQDEVHNGQMARTYVPTKITDATLVLSNPGSDSVSVECTVSMTALVAPRNKVQTLAFWTFPIGFVLALPWGISFLRTKTKRFATLASLN